MSREEHHSDDYGGRREGAGRKPKPWPRQDLVIRADDEEYERILDHIPDTRVRAQILLDAAVECIIWNWRNLHDDLPDEAVQNFIESLETEARNYAAELEDDELKRWVAFNMHYQRSCRCARQHGYELADLAFDYNPIALIDYAQGREAGVELAEQYDFSTKPAGLGPGSMWDILEERRLDNDCAIVLIGDDRGWADDWKYFAAIAWAPVWLVEESGFISGLV